MGTLCRELCASYRKCRAVCVLESRNVAAKRRSGSAFGCAITRLGRATQRWIPCLLKLPIVIGPNDCLGVVRVNPPCGDHRQRPLHSPPSKPYVESSCLRAVSMSDHDNSTERLCSLHSAMSRCRGALASAAVEGMGLKPSFAIRSLMAGCSSTLRRAALSLSIDGRYQFPDGAQDPCHA